MTKTVLSNAQLFVLLAAILFGTTSVIFTALWWGRKPARKPAPATPADDQAATATALLRPDDPALPDDEAQLIASTIAYAVDAYASVLAAKRAGLDPAVVQRLTDQMYADLVRALTPTQLARAATFGLRDHAGDRARRLLDTDSLSISDLES
ncbi:hypothetical protein OOJ91_13955 [Micromonospora lupini]|uniref:hypothetical protein n=1 Tax=Micromonospora lupini TaxID=285679 RepID=UPI0022585779|nr:hypothetical protein [Micromonospora lupini]MCX5066952.1 hypothetical protein [Micromonospora lupini]